MIKITTRKGLCASIDWLQVRIFGMKFEDIARNILGIPEEYFNVESGRLQHYNYDYCYRFGDIRIYDYLETNYDDYFWYESKGFEPGDNMLVLSGKACEFLREVWLSQMNISFKTFMKNLLVYEKKITITRIDVAIDDFNEKPFFTPTQLTKLCQKKQFVYGKSTTYLPYGDEQTGATLYLKPPSADDRLKFYDKQAELAKAQGLRKKDLPPQIRTEVVFRREKAHNFFLEYVNVEIPLLELFQGYLKGKVKFYSDPAFQTPLRSWQRFLGSVETFTLSIPKQQVALYKKIGWLENGGGLAIYKAVKFLKEKDIFPTELGSIDYHEAQYPRDLANELKKYVSELGRTDLIEEIDLSTKYY